MHEVHEKWKILMQVGPQKNAGSYKSCAEWRKVLLQCMLTSLDVSLAYITTGLSITPIQNSILVCFAGFLTCDFNLVYFLASLKNFLLKF